MVSKECIKLNSRVILFVILIVFISLVAFALYKPKRKQEQLILVNWLSRHGDRAPTSFPKGDQHEQYASTLWPNGLGELTEQGKARMRALGRVAARLVNDPEEVLYLSSPVRRCIDSITNFAQGYRSGIDKLQIDTELIPSLDYNYVYESPYVKKRPNMTNRDFQYDYPYLGPKLMDRLRSQYGITTLSNEAFNLWQTIKCEKQLRNASFDSHYLWSEEPLTPYDPDATKLDFLGFVTANGYYDQLDAPAHYLSTSPIITSIFQSQVAAMGYRDIYRDENYQYYSGKKLIVYMSHDTVLDMLLRDLNISMPSSQFDIADHIRSDSSSQLVLNRVAPPNFGFTARFELWMLEGGYPMVRLKIYNEKSYTYASDISEDSFENVKLGEICERNLGRVGNGKFDCPLEQFRAMVSPWMLNIAKYNMIYTDNDYP